eukprot:gene5390-6875_t
MIKKEEQKVDVIKLLTNVPDASSTSNKVYNDADADAGVNLKGPVSDDDLDSSSDDDDEEDDEEELQRELARIKEERLAAQLLKQQQEREEQER